MSSIAESLGVAESNWSILSRLSWEEVQGLDTDLGPVRTLRMQAGHHLVCKVETSDMTDGARGGAPIALPMTHVRKSVGNLNAIRGVVLRASEPYCAKIVRKIKRWTYREKRGEWQREQASELFNGRRLPSQVQEGDAIIYNSYAVAHILVPGFVDPFAIVREIDIEIVFPRGAMNDIDVGDHALSCPALS